MSHLSRACDTDSALDADSALPCATVGGSFSVAEPKRNGNGHGYHDFTGAITCARSYTQICFWALKVEPLHFLIGG
jgi:hypothetical protein